eukprot:TRINITY_DN15246_c0_g1_i1.p1 TRINITY_DN15246_c0_g1~~TRINITY_DN15246_c0_g1_i1.p1  ORF type:complete len:100 (+),score=7.33 TRINITY_DN15246_c0_g1_i1:35-334(+)
MCCYGFTIRHHQPPMPIGIIGINIASSIGLPVMLHAVHVAYFMTKAKVPNGTIFINHSQTEPTCMCICVRGTAHIGQLFYKQEWPYLQMTSARLGLLKL